MYLLNFSLFLKQLLPPPWRAGWQHTVIYALLHPLEHVARAFSAERSATRVRLQVSMQVFSLQAVLSNIMQSPVRIEHRASNPHTFFVRVHLPTDVSTQEITDRKAAINQLLKRHRLAGTFFEIEDVQA